MKDEIKEKIKAYYMDNDIDEVLDYITNLQEENERLKQEQIGKYQTLKDLQEENEELKAELQEVNDSATWWSNRFKAVERDNKNYKSRNEKYENVINEIKEKIDDYFGYDYENESQARLDTINEINHIIVDLYNGGDE